MLRLPFELGLALRYLRPKLTFVSVITLLCIMGVTIGVAVLIIVIAVMTGFDRELRQKLVGFNAHLRVGIGGGQVEHPEALMKLIREEPHVRGAAPFVVGQVLIRTQPDPKFAAPQSRAPLIRGMDAELEGQISVLTNSIIEGSFDLRGNGLVVGVSLAEELDLHAGDSVAVYSTHAMDRMFNSLNTQTPTLSTAENFTVRGIYRVGHYQLDQLYIGTSLANAQDLMSLGDLVNGVSVMLDTLDESTTRTVQRRLEERLGPPYQVVSWMDENAIILGAIEDEKSAMLVILFFVMIVAAFCIVCSQIAFVIRKTREIGILKGLGATTGQVVAVFFVQSFAVGCIGVVVGWLAGLGGVAVRNQFLMGMRWITGRDLFSAAVYNFEGLPALVLPRDVLLICGVSLVMCLVAGVVPALIVATLRPVEALRNE